MIISLAAKLDLNKKPYWGFTIAIATQKPRAIKVKTMMILSLAVVYLLSFKNDSYVNERKNRQFSAANA